MFCVTMQRNVATLSISNNIWWIKEITELLAYDFMVITLKYSSTPSVFMDFKFVLVKHD
jgi:hypothetical protein